MDAGGLSNSNRNRNRKDAHVDSFTEARKDDDDDELASVAHVDHRCEMERG